MEVGSLQIGGSVDTQAIESGLSRVETGLKNVSASGNSVNSDFTRIGQSANYLEKRLKVIGTVGVASIIGLAKGAPAVAGAMANIKVSFGKLSRELGDSLSPAFNIASSAFRDFVGWVSDNSSFIDEFSTNIVSGLVSTVKELYNIWTSFSSTTIPFLDINVGEGIKYLVSNFGSEAVAGLIGGKLFGPIGALTGAGISAVANSDAQTDYSPLLGIVGGAVGAAAGPVGIAAGFGIGALIGKGIDLFLSKNDRKASSLDLEYGV